MQWFLFLAFLIVLAVSVFAIQNSQQVALRFLYWELPSFPLVMLILFSAATGVLVTLLFTIAKHLKLTVQIRSLQSQVKHLEKKLSSMADHGKTDPGCEAATKPGHGNQ